MKVYISTRTLHPPSSGGAFQFTIGIANALSLIPGVRIIAGITGANSPIARKYFNKDIRTIELDGSEEKVISRSEEAVIAGEDPAWCIYPYPSRQDRYSEKSKVKYCSIMFDLQHVAFPKFFSKAERWKREESFGNAILNADLIATISEFSSKEIQKYYPDLRINPSVIYAGAQINSHKKLSDKLFKKRFLLYPANAWAHKNHETLFKAFTLLKNQHPDLKLVLTGDRKNAPPSFLENLKIEGVEHRGYVSSEVLLALRTQAACVVFPSLYEGFGMPVIESLGQGTPVACSNNSSLTEVGGQAAEYFDPIDPIDMAQAIERAINNRSNSSWQQKAVEQAMKFTFERTAHLLMDAMKKIDSEATTSCLQDLSPKSDAVAFGTFWRSYPGVDAVLLSTARSTVTSLSPKNCRALDPLALARLNPQLLSRLVMKGGNSSSGSMPWNLREYEALLGLVAQNKLVVYESAVGEQRLVSKIPRSNVLRILILQLRYFKRTCRETVMALVTGLWK